MRRCALVLVLVGLSGWVFAALCAEAATPTATTPSLTQKASPKEGDILVYTQFISSRQESESLGDAALGAVANPVVGPILVVGAAYFGVPPQYVAAVAGAAAKAQQEKSEASRNSPQKGVHLDTLQPPIGYDICAIRVGAISIHPGETDRPKVTILGSRSSVAVTTVHQKQAFGSGRSTVKLEVDILAVRSTAREAYASQCLSQATVTLVSACRGSECAPRMTRTTWYNGK